MTPTTTRDCCPVIELRQYTLKPGQRDVLIDLFDREFVETQEAVGIRVIGQFRDRDRPDRFVWIRGFPDMNSRALALDAFYGGPVWKAHRDAANTTMVDSDNVLLLKPAAGDAAFALPDTARAPAGATESPPSRIVATIYYRDQPIDETFVRFFDREVAPVLTATGARPIARFETEPARNTFPRLPVREGEHVFVWFAAFDDEAALDRHDERLAADPAWATTVRPELLQRLSSVPERLVLEPTARSLLR